MGQFASDYKQYFERLDQANGFEIFYEEGW